MPSLALSNKIASLKDFRVILNFNFYEKRRVSISYFKNLYETFTVNRFIKGNSSFLESLNSQRKCSVWCCYGRSKWAILYGRSCQASCAMNFVPPVLWKTGAKAKDIHHQFCLRGFDSWDPQGLAHSKLSHCVGAHLSPRCMIRFCHYK